MFINVEGADRVGKDTLLLALDKKLKWANCNMMRGPAGCLTYDQIYGRDTQQRINEAISVARAFKSTKHLIIYLYASPEVITERLEQEKAEGGSGFFAPVPYSIQDVLDLYEQNIDMLYSSEEVLKIDTGKMTLEEELNLVCERIEQIQNMPMQLVCDITAGAISSRNSGDFRYVQYYPFSYTFLKSELDSYGAFDINVDRPYYEMLEKCLAHVLYERQLGWINDRQMIYTSNDCIPFVQIVKQFDGILFIVNQRSCDIEKHKFNDVMFFKYFADTYLKNTNYAVQYTCAVPHKYIPKTFDETL